MGLISKQPRVSRRWLICTAELIPVDLTVESADDSALLSGIKAAFKTPGKRFVYVCLNEGELSGDDLQRIANHLKSDIRTLDETLDGKNCYYIFKVK